MDVITFPVNRLTTSGLQILLHCVISLPDATSYDKKECHMDKVSYKMECRNVRSMLLDEMYQY